MSRMDTATGLLNQFRKPTGWFGRLNLASMNRRHSRLTRSTSRRSAGRSEMRILLLQAVLGKVLDRRDLEAMKAAEK
jgi:hypothetical protein